MFLTESLIKNGMNFNRRAQTCSNHFFVLTLIAESLRIEYMASWYPLTELQEFGDVLIQMILMLSSSIHTCCIMVHLSDT